MTSSPYEEMIEKVKTALDNIFAKKTDVPSDLNDLTDEYNIIPSASTGLSDSNTLVRKSQIVGLIKNDGTIDTTHYISDISNKINTSDITDNLTTDNSNKVLSAKQGYNLKSWLGDIDNIEDKFLTTDKVYSSNDDDYLIFGDRLIYAYDEEKVCYLKNPQNPSVETDEIATLNDIPTLSTVATTGSYTNLTDKPSYTPTITSSTNGAYKIGSINISGSSVDIYGKDTDTHQSLANYVSKSNTEGLLKNDGSVMTGGTGASNWAIGNHTHSGYASSTHRHTELISEMGMTYFNDDLSGNLTGFGDRIIYDYGDTDKVYYDDGNGNGAVADNEIAVKSDVARIDTLIGSAISYINQ